jgi:hypothetical protein
MAELPNLPETFSAADLGYPGRPLLVNTGCWLADLSAPIWADFAFQITSEVLPEGVQVSPEDWLMSEALYDAGCHVLATKKVRVKHLGEAEWQNFGWEGEQRREEGFTRPWPCEEPACQTN